MKELWRYLQKYKKECVLAPLFKMLEASFELMIPLVMRTIIDQGIGGSDAPLIVRMVLLMVALGLVGLLAAVTAQYFSAKAATGFAVSVRHALFEHMEALSFSNMDRMGTSTMITRMTSDVNQAQTGVNMTLRLFLRSPFVVFGAMVMAFTIDTRSALIFVAVIAALSLVVFGLMAMNIPMMRGVQRALEDVLGATRENLTGARVIRAFRREDAQYEEFLKRNEALVNRQKRAGRVSGLMNPVTYLMINFAIAWLIHTGALQVQTGILTAGQVVALYNYMSQILVELIKLANLIVTMNKAFASWKRIEDVLRLQPDMREDGSVHVPAIHADEAVRFENVSLHYPTAGEESLQDISFTALRGQMIGVIGGTGSGKSSLARLIPRFYDASHGAVLVDGMDVREWSQAELRHKVGYVPQKAVLFHGTIRDNLKWGNPDATDEDLMNAVRAAQAEDVVNAKGGLNAMLEQGGRNLSGGQRQRLTIARALARRPEILVLDDSASALDQATDKRLRKAIRALDYHPTTFVISQRAASIRRADQIVVLEDGKMAGLGTHAQLMEQCEVYREIYESQYGGEASA
ncbi:MAG: ABC transporter ATP-binding protein [Clostridia bacterium]|nr:ABC transporter ATP-binding protein [Clostridia bacterium]MBQ8971498.1 ABC transporter ATP-binding protein [Clostridia bacterium]